MLNFIDLFCGAGGFSKGFLLQGYNPLLGVDNEFHKSYTYFKNINPKYTLRGTKTFYSLYSNNSLPSKNKDLFQNTYDISTLESNTILDTIHNEHIDLIIGSPPCKDFSSANFSSKIDPTRSILVNEFFRLVKDLSPTWFVLENVPNFFCSSIGRPLTSKFQLLGYTTRLLSLDSNKFNIPQNRTRGFLIGSKKIGVNLDTLTLESYFADNPISIKDAISDLELQLNNTPIINYPKEATTAYQHLMRKNEIISSNGVPVVYNHITSNLRSKTLPKLLKRKSKLPSNKYSKIAGTILTQSNQFVSWGECLHPKPNLKRPYSIRECARLQSFTDDFIFYGTSKEQMLQVGDAVPPFLSEVIAKIILDLSN